MRYLLSVWACMLCMSCAKPRFTVSNKGIGGNNSAELLARLQRDVLSQQPDLVILMGGTNDLINSRKLIPAAQYQRNILQMADSFRAHGIRFVLMSPPPVDTGYLFMRHDRRLYAGDPNRSIDSLRPFLQETARRYKAGFIDIGAMFRAHGEPRRDAASLFVNTENLGKPDGVHPTREGYKAMAQYIYDALRQQHLLRGVRKVVCFGDSITYGAFMDEAGTAKQGTYPGFLLFLLQNGRYASKS
ncbi:SGNH/GDSL hydrolase family protein [Chitinophaga lutea]